MNWTKELVFRIFSTIISYADCGQYKIFNKGETVKQFEEAFQISKKVGIKTYASFVDGAPSETAADRKLTDDFINNSKPDFVGRNLYVGIPGSELYEYIKENNLYEYEDELHILYPIGFHKKVKRYYKNNKYFQVYSRLEKYKFLLSKKINKYFNK